MADAIIPGVTDESVWSGMTQDQIDSAVENGDLAPETAKLIAEKSGAEPAPAKDDLAERLALGPMANLFINADRPEFVQAREERAAAELGVPPGIAADAGDEIPPLIARPDPVSNAPLSANTVNDLVAKGAMRPETASRFGGGGAVSTLKRGQKLAMDTAEESVERTRDALEVQEQAVMAGLEAGLAKSAAERVHIEAKAAAMEEQAARVAKADALRKQKVDESRAALAHATEMAQTQLPEAEYMHHKSVIEDPYATAEQKNQSRKAIDSSSHVDPFRMFGEGGTKALAVVAMLLGAGGSKLGSGLQQLVNGLISMDVARQRDKLGRKRKNLTFAEKMHEDILKATGSERTAQLGVEKMRIEALAQRAEADLSKLEDGEQKAKALERVGELRAMVAEKDNAIEAEAVKEANRLIADEAQMRYRIAEKNKAAADAVTNNGLAVNGLVRIGPATADDAKAVRKAKPALDSAMAGLDRAIALRDGSAGMGDGAAWTEDERAIELTDLREAMIADLTRISESGVLNAGEYERFKEEIGDLTGTGSWGQAIMGHDTILTKLKMLRKRFERKAMAIYKAHWFSPEREARDSRHGFDAD